MPSPSRSRRALSIPIALVAVIAVAGALFAATKISSGAPKNTVALASKSRTNAACPAANTKKVDVRSKVGTYVDSRGAIQHIGDGQEPFVPANCSPSRATTVKSVAAKPQRVVCRSVVKALPRVPARAAKQVKRDLNSLKQQIDQANARLARRPLSQRAVQETVLKPLKAKRVVTINRIAKAIGRTATQKATKRRLLKLAPCTVTAPENRPVEAPANPGAPQPPANDPGQQPPATPPTATAPPENPPGGLDILAKDCSKSKLQPHDGFQNGNRCVSTAFGEVGEAAKNPSLLIQDAPATIKAGDTFTIAVSTRNLVRDRFLAAGQGGYYVESSLLNDQGLVRGHFHTACRMLQGNEAPDPAPVPAFFVATEDGSGGAQPDTVKITVAGLTTPGTAQCAVWAGDGSHRIPMMQRANQTPAIDAVRIQVQ